MRLNLRLTKKQYRLAMQIPHDSWRHRRSCRQLQQLPASAGTTCL